MRCAHGTLFIFGHCRAAAAKLFLSASEASLNWQLFIIYYSLLTEYIHHNCGMSQQMAQSPIMRFATACMVTTGMRRRVFTTSQ